MDKQKLCDTIQDRFRILKEVVTNHDDWECCHKNDHVIVKKLSSPKEPTTGLPIYQAIGHVGVTPEQLLEGAILNPDHLSEWSSVETIKVITDYTNDCKENNNIPFQIYRQTHAPVLNGLISPRDFINYRSWEFLENKKKLFFVCSSTEHPDFLPSKNFVRGNVYITAVHAEFLENEKVTTSRVHYVVQVSIGGWVPQWAVNRGIVDEMSDTYPRLNKLFEKWLKEQESKKEIENKQVEKEKE